MTPYEFDASGRTNVDVSKTTNFGNFRLSVYSIDGVPNTLANDRFADFAVIALIARNGRF